MRALYCLSFGPKKEYVETDFKPVEYRLGTTLIAFLSTDFASLRAKLLVRTTPMMENQAITEIKNALSAIHPFGERFVQSLFFEEKLADVLDERMEGFEKLQKELSAFADAVLVPDIYPGREKDTGAVHARDMVAAINAAGTTALYLPTFEDIRSWLDEHGEAGDVVVTVGSGDVYRQTRKLL